MTDRNEGISTKNKVGILISKIDVKYINMTIDE